MADCPKRRICSHFLDTSVTCHAKRRRLRFSFFPLTMSNSTGACRANHLLQAFLDIGRSRRLSTPFCGQRRVKGSNPSVKEHQPRNGHPHAPVNHGAHPDNHPVPKDPGGLTFSPEVRSRPCLAAGGALYMLARARLSSTFGKKFSRTCQRAPASLPPPPRQPSLPATPRHIGAQRRFRQHLHRCKICMPSMRPQARRKVACMNHHGADTPCPPRSDCENPLTSQASACCARRALICFFSFSAFGDSSESFALSRKASSPPRCSTVLSACALMRKR